MDKILISKEKLEELKNELNELVNVKRPAVIKLIQDARAQGDLSENAEYDSAKDEQGRIEGRINDINSILENYELIAENKTSGGVVRIGSKVKIQDGKEETEYTLVGIAETDVLNNKISIHSPLAKAIMGHKAGETITVLGVETPYKIKINAIA